MMSDHVTSETAVHSAIREGVQTESMLAAVDGTGCARSRRVRPKTEASRFIAESPGDPCKI